jgi:putative ABC transport system permease protein
MLKSFLISYFRSLYRNKTTSFINIFGLALGLASCFIILLFVLSELKVDHFQKNRKSIYRTITTNQGSGMMSAQASYLFGPAAKQEFPEVKNFARTIYLGSVKVKKEKQLVDESGFLFADPSIFDMLTFNFLEGSYKNAINGYVSIAISKGMAHKYFGDENPIGKPITVSIKGEEQLLTVSAVFADLPETSSIKIDWIGNLEFGKKNLMKMLITYGNSDEEQPKIWKDSWDHLFYTNFIQLTENTDITSFEAKLNKGFQKYKPEDETYNYTFQRFDKIYLHSDNIGNDNGWTHGNLTNIYIFSAVAFLILLIACFNYLILSLAQSEKRAREIGIRKASGADFKSLVRQVTIESVAFSFIALPLAIGITELLLPLVNSVLDKALVIHYTQNLEFICGIIIITIIISLISGFYLAFYLNRFNPAQILRGSKVRSGTRSTLLKSLVIAQIAIFIALIISSITIFKQLAFVKSYNPGMDAGNVLSLNMSDVLAQQNYAVLKGELERMPEVKSFGTCLFMPPSNSHFTMGVPRVDDPSKTATVEALLADYGFIETLGLKFIEGRPFSKDFPSDAGGVVLNESAVSELGLKETIGTKLPFGTVIGVVKDFHIHDLHSKITPAYFVISPQFFWLAIKTKTDAVAVIPKIKAIWEKLNPDTHFECELLTNKIEAQYTAEKKFSMIILLFTLVAILIASLGLFGLSSFITLLRTKEIGIRKVNGGTIGQMLLLFSREIFWWTTIAFIIAVPAAWYAMHQWLENFAYKTSLSWWIFIGAGAVALAISLISVSWQAYRAASRNPVEALRYE